MVHNNYHHFLSGLSATVSCNCTPEEASLVLAFSDLLVTKLSFWPEWAFTPKYLPLQVLSWK